MKAMKTARVGELKSVTATAVALAPDRTSPPILQAVARVASGAYEIDPTGIAERVNLVSTGSHVLHRLKNGRRCPFRGQRHSSRGC